MKSFLTGLKKTFDYSGRASMKEYWLFILFAYVLPVALCAGGYWLMDSYVWETGGGAMLLIAFILWFVTGLSQIALTMRRLHDQGMSGAWFFLVFAPFGTLILFIFMLVPGTHGPNRYGPDPRYPHQNGHPPMNTMTPQD